MSRKLFCEWHPITYRLSVIKGILLRRLQWVLNRKTYAKTYSDQNLCVQIYKHKSLIRRRLGDVDMQLQDNKAINLSLAAPKVNGIVIQPNEVFSFWRLVGKATQSKGYKEGLTIRSGKVSRGIGGGMCQFTNLIHWMILHSPLTILEHHHHNELDLFPDYGRQVPFGTGTSIMYNYLDYQFVNHTNQTFQLITYTTDDYLCGELRSDRVLNHKYHIIEENNYFIKENGAYYRNNEIFQTKIDKKTGNAIDKKLVICNHAKVMYDEGFIDPNKIRLSS